MRSVAAIVLAVALAVPVRASAQPEPASESGLTNAEAIAHFERGQAYFEAKNFAGAATELEAAYAIEPTPGLLYAWAQAERYAGNCKEAMPLYARYLETNPDGESRDAAEESIVECAGREDDPPKDEPPPDDAIKPARRDWLGATFIGLGVATGIAGGVLLGIGQQEVNASGDAPTEDDYFDEVAAGRKKHTAGIVLLSVAGAFVLAAIVRYSVLAAKNRKQREAQTTLLVPRRGFGLGLGVRF